MDLVSASDHPGTPDEGGPGVPDEGRPNVADEDRPGVPAPSETASSSAVSIRRAPKFGVFIVGGALPFLWLCWLGVRHRTSKQVVMVEPEDTLFTEIGEPVTVGAADSDR